MKLVTVPWQAGPGTRPAGAGACDDSEIMITQLQSRPRPPWVRRSQCPAAAAAGRGGGPVPAAVTVTAQAPMSGPCLSTSHGRSQTGLYQPEIQTRRDGLGPGVQCQ